MTPAATNAEGELAIVVRCHTMLAAIPARAVARLVLDDEAEHVSNRGRPVLRVTGEAHAAWRLGALLDLPPASASWVLIHLLHRGRTIPIALGTDACIVVRALRVEAPLPRGIWRARGAAFSGAFTTTALRGGGESLFGLWLEPASLFSIRELDAAASTLDGLREATP